MRDLFMHLHEVEVITIRWSKEIEAEWTRNVVAKQDANPQAIQNCLIGMRSAIEDWEVSGYEKHIEKFEAVDEKDRHVAAAAYKLSLSDWPGQPVALVTKNVADFPQHAFGETLVTRFSMATYIDALYAAKPDEVIAVAEGCRKKLKTPVLTREFYVGVLMKHGCSALAEGLASKWKVECPAVAKDGTLYYESEQKATKPKRSKK
jgi:hypothetical protein